MKKGNSEGKKGEGCESNICIFWAGENIIWGGGSMVFGLNVYPL